MNYISTHSKKCALRVVPTIQKATGNLSGYVVTLFGALTAATVIKVACVAAAIIVAITCYSYFKTPNNTQFSPTPKQNNTTSLPNPLPTSSANNKPVNSSPPSLINPVIPKNPTPTTPTTLSTPPSSSTPSSSTLPVTPSQIATEIGFLKRIYKLLMTDTQNTDELLLALINQIFFPEKAYTISKIHLTIQTYFFSVHSCVARLKRYNQLNNTLQMNFKNCERAIPLEIQELFQSVQETNISEMFAIDTHQNLAFRLEKLIGEIHEKNPSYNAPTSTNEALKGFCLTPEEATHALACAKSFFKDKNIDDAFNKMTTPLAAASSST